MTSRIRQLKHFSFKDADELKRCNEFLAAQGNEVIDIQCTNNGYGSHVYILYWEDEEE